MFNRRHAVASLERELHRAARQQLSGGVLMIDVDRIKSFNDSFGHDAGDALLCRIAEYFSEFLRGEEIACRYGGEEFLVVLPDASGADVARRAEELRRDVRKLFVLPHGSQAKQSTTISVGIAMYPDHGLIAAELLRAADVALYQAKAAGRDQVVVALIAAEPKN